MVKSMIMIVIKEELIFLVKTFALVIADCILVIAPFSVFKKMLTEKYRPIVLN